MYDSVKDSGKRQEFGTGAVRDTGEGKGRYDLLPAYALHRIAQHFENGAKKYGDENWRKGIPLRRYLDSGIRHAFKYLEGHRDEDHAAAAAWNFLALIETEEMVRRGVLPASLDNLPDWTEPPAVKMPQHDLEPLPDPLPLPLTVYRNASNQFDPRRWRLNGDVVQVQYNGEYGGKWHDITAWQSMADVEYAIGDSVRPVSGPVAVDLDECGTTDGTTPIAEKIAGAVKGTLRWLKDN